MNKADFFSNTQGLNLTDSPFYVKDGQSTGGYNYEYTKTGAITKIRGLTKVNDVADSETHIQGIATHDTSENIKTVLLAAGTKLQTLDIDSQAIVNITDDTTLASTDFFSGSSSQQVVSSGFNSSTNNLTWLAGGGLTLPIAYNGTHATVNGVSVPTGTFTAVNLGSGAGSGWVAGVYYYALVLRKTSTQALSNAALDQSVTIATATDSVLLTFPVGVDTTLYDKWYIYRSSVSGVTAFTAGSLVAKVDIADATYTDLNVTLVGSQNVPRNGNTILDNSQLPANTYNYLATYKRHLVIAAGTTVYFSDLDKPESWPAGATITIPSGGAITGLQTIGYNSPNTGTTDEYLMIFKQKELWVITGSGAYDQSTGLYDYTLKYVDAVGCITQALSVRCNGFVAWIDYRGIYIWNGLDKPTYCSRPIEALFGQDGDLDKVNIGMGFGVFFREKNQVIWTVSHRIKGINKLQIKLDLRLTVPQLSNNFSGNNILEGVFACDSYSTPLFAGSAFLPNTGSELFLVADHSGFVYKAYYGTSDDGAGIDFSYMTKAHDFGQPTVAKQYSKVVVYIDNSVSKYLTLSYWSNYSTLTEKESQISRNMDTGVKVSASLWDLAIWDTSRWDEYNTQIVPLVFNLQSVQNNNQGDSIQLKFSQNDVDAPVTIYGYSIFWDTIGIRK